MLTAARAATNAHVAEAALARAVALEGMVSKSWGILTNAALSQAQQTAALERLGQELEMEKARGAAARRPVAVPAGAR